LSSNFLDEAITLNGTVPDTVHADRDTRVARLAASGRRFADLELLNPAEIADLHQAGQAGSVSPCYNQAMTLKTFRRLRPDTDRGRTTYAMPFLHQHG
jgi:hypothetical protein